MRRNILILIACSALFSACMKGPQEEKQAAEIEAVKKSIDSTIGWFKNKDFDLLFMVIADDPRYLSVHPTDKVIVGRKEFEKSAEIFRIPEFTYVRHELKDLKITLSRSGDVAWFFCRLDDINTYKGEPANWENARWTGVLEKRDGSWVMMQQHFSFASD